MLKCEIRSTTFNDLKKDDDFETLIRSYARESYTGRHLKVEIDVNQYLELEKVADFHLFGAYFKDKLIGFGTVIICLMPHYSKKIASIESLFVSHRYRATGAGLELIDAIENIAKERGAVGLMANAPLAGKLESLLPYINYEKTHTSFFKIL